MSGFQLLLLQMLFISIMEPRAIHASAKVEGKGKSQELRTELVSGLTVEISE